MVLTFGREGMFPLRMSSCEEGAEQARLKVRRAFAIVPPAFCPSYFGPQANRRDTGKLDVVPVWGLRRRPFARSVPGCRSVLEDGAGRAEGCFFRNAAQKEGPFGAYRGSRVKEAFV